MGLSLGREIGVNIPAGDDFASWCMAAMAFLGLAHTFKSGEMIRVGLLIDRFSAAARAGVRDRLARRSASASSASSPGTRSRFTYDSCRFNDMAQGVLAVPLWIPQLGYAAGLVILAIAFLDEFVHVLAGGAPRYEKPPAGDRRGGRRARDAERGLGDGPRRDLRPAPPPARGAAGGRRLDRHRADGLRLGRHAVRRRRRSRRAPCSRRRSGATPPPGRSRRCRSSSGWARFCSHPAVGGDVPRPRALAQLAAGPAPARQRAGLRHLRLGLGLLGRDLRHRRQDRPAGTEEARLRRAW